MFEMKFDDPVKSSEMGVIFILATGSRSLLLSKLCPGLKLVSQNWI